MHVRPYFPEVKLKGVHLRLFDVPGGEKVRDLWKHHFQDTDAVVWFVDSSQPDRFNESKTALELALKDPNMRKDIPILIAANKCDKEGAKSEEEIKEALDLKNFLEGRQWTVVRTNAKKGTGVSEGFKWLSAEIKLDHKKRKKAEH